MAHRRGRTDGLVCCLRCFLLFIDVRRLRQVILAVLRHDVLAHFRQSFVRNAGGIGTHISNETDRTFFAQFHTLIKALRDHHGAFDAEAQLARGVLLQFAGGKRRSGIAPALFAIDCPDQPVGLFQSSADFICFLTVVNFDLLFALAKKTGVECRRLGPCKVSINGPIFLLLEGFDFPLAFDNEPQRNGLDPARGQSATDLVPQQG